jgi:DNA-binding transcriptional MocR family regulator
VAATFAASGVPTAPDEVLVTTGTQQGLSLAAALAIRPGDVALVENPTSPGVLDALRAAGADIRAVPVGPHGARLDTIEEQMTRLSPRLVVVVPTFHNPTAAVMPAGARRRLAALAERLQILVAEDLSHADIVLGQDPPPPPLAHYAGAHVLSLGSMSKLFWGGLRVGWVRAPAWRWTRPAGGLSAWVELPEGNATAYAQVAQRHGVSVVPGPLLSPDESHQRHLRISFAPGLAAIAERVDRLAAACAAHAQGPADAPAAML